MLNRASKMGRFPLSRRKLPFFEQHRSYSAQEEPSEPGYGGFLLSNDAPDLSNPGYSFDTRVSSVEDGFVQPPPISRKQKYISQRKTNLSLSSQTTAVLERRRIQNVVGVQQRKERQEDNDALRRKFVEDSIKYANIC